MNTTEEKQAWKIFSDLEDQRFKELENYDGRPSLEDKQSDAIDQASLISQDPELCAHYGLEV